MPSSDAEARRHNGQRRRSASSGLLQAPRARAGLLCARARRRRGDERIRSWRPSRRNSPSAASRPCATSSPTWSRAASGPTRPSWRMPPSAPRWPKPRRLLPKLPLIAGGKSFGGRMTSQAQAAAPLPGVRGLAFLGFPLHPAGRPSQRARRASVRSADPDAVPAGHARHAGRCSISSSRFARRSASARP